MRLAHVIRDSMLHTVTTTQGLHSGFLRSAALHPERAALEIGNDVLTYAQLRERAQRISAALRRVRTDEPQAVGILASRSVTTYAGVLGTLMAGATVVPLNPGFPAERTLQMIDLGDVTALIADGGAQHHLDDILRAAPRTLLVLLPAEIMEAYATRWPQHRFASHVETVGVSDAIHEGDVAQRFAYLFFTSGSTGVPKGVGVLHGNATRFVEMSVERYRELGLSETDRFSQFYDITFDSSMFDLFVAWAFGGCLCCPTAVEWINPNKFIVDKGLTVIDIVPSTGHAMNRRNGWRAGRFQTLRLCRFGGEALSSELALQLATAAPQAAIDNVYGPTECTVDATYYRWDRALSPNEATHGIVPIGSAGPRVKLRVVDADLREVAEGGEGELLISGPQVTPGYWKDSQRTEASFIRLPDGGDVFYRTGDLVRRVPEGEPFPYLGRMDHQIKISGVRIELGEVESAMRAACGAQMAVALGWPITSSGAAGIVGFVAKRGADGAQIRHALKQTLPAVMVPREIFVVDELPLNINGKVDRKALVERLRAAAQQP